MGLLGADDGPDDEVGRLVANAKGDSVTRERLTEKKEGIVTKNLSERPIVAHLADDEQPHFVLYNVSKGITVEREYGEHEVEQTGAHRAFAVVTDRRMLLLVGRNDGDREISIPYENVAGFHLESGSLVHYHLTVRTANATCSFPVNGNEIADEEIAEVRDYLAEKVGRDSDPASSGIELSLPGGPVRTDRGGPSEGTASGGSSDGTTTSGFDGGTTTDSSDSGTTTDGSDGAAADAEDSDRATADAENSDDGPTSDDGGTSDDGDERADAEATDDGSDEPDEAIQILREQFARGEISTEEYETRLEVLQDTS